MKMEKQTWIEDEHEPRTLHFRHIKYAREAALYVVNTRSMQEAFAVFSEGLDPVVRCTEGDGCKSLTTYVNDAQDKMRPNDSNGRVQVQGLRDVASAPF